MPIIGDGSKSTPRQPKYASTHLAGINWNMMDYGDEPFCLVAADLGSGHSALAAESDVTALPADLNQEIGGQLSTVQNTLESLNIPSDWVQSTHTYKRVLRAATLIFQIAQRHQGLSFGRIFTAGVTLDTQFNQLSSTARNRLLSVAQTMKLDTSGLGGASTLRQILKALADQLEAFNVWIGDNQL